MGREDHPNYWTARRVSRRRVLGGFATGVIGVGLAGCAGTASAPTVAPAATTAPAAPTAAATAAVAAASPTPAAKRGGIAHAIGTSAERNLEAHVGAGVSTAANYGSPNLCYSQLLTYKWGADVKVPSYIPTGELAESWTQPDDLTYVFKLRPGAKWHNIAPANGRDLTAEDVIYSYERVRTLKQYAGYLLGIVKWEAVDKSTLKLTLDKPNADLLDNLSSNTLVIVNRERDAMTGGSLADPPLVGSGPFILESFTVNDRAVIKRNPDYYIKGLPILDGIESNRAAEPAILVNAFRAGSVDTLAGGITVQQSEDIRKSVPTADIRFNANDRNTIELMLDHKLDLFKDVRVRQAISKAIDRKAIVDTVWQGKGAYTTGLSFPDPSYQLPDAELTKLLGRDVEGAKQLLKAAGKDTGLSFEIIAPNYLSGAFITLTELIQANLKEVGITTNIRTADTATWSTAQQTGNYQANTGTFAGAAPNGWLNLRYKTGGGQNWSKYSDPEMDKLIDQQFILSKDPEGRKKVLQDIQRKIINDAVYIPLLLYFSPVVVASYLKDFYPPIAGNGHDKYWTTVWLNK